MGSPQRYFGLSLNANDEFEGAPFAPGKMYSSIPGRLFWDSVIPNSLHGGRFLRARQDVQMSTESKNLR